MGQDFFIRLFSDRPKKIQLVQKMNKFFNLTKKSTLDVKAENVDFYIPKIMGKKVGLNNKKYLEEIFEKFISTKPIEDNNWKTVTIKYANQPFDFLFHIHLDEMNYHTYSELYCNVHAFLLPTKLTPTKIVKKNYARLIKFSIFASKILEEDSFVGFLDGETLYYAVLFASTKPIEYFMQNYFKQKFNISLTEELIKKLIKDYSQLNKKINGYNVVLFLKFNEQGIENRFFQELKKLKGEN